MKNFAQALGQIIKEEKEKDILKSIKGVSSLVDKDKKAPEPVSPKTFKIAKNVTIGIT